MRHDPGALARLAALPRFAPAVLLAAWMIALAADASHPWIGSVVGTCAAATLLVADLHPAVPLVAAFGGLLTADALGGVARDDAWLMLIVCACFCMGRFGRRGHQLAAGAAICFLLAMNVADRGLDTGVGDVVFPLLFSAGPWLIGLALQVAVRRAAAASDHAAEVVASSAAAIDRATAEERLRIARDLHDVVAHNISALSLQAQTARRRTEAGREVDTGELRAIEHTAQAAMRDLRGILGVLRPTPGIAIAGPHEGLGQLPDLLATASRVGQRIRLSVSGEPRDLPPALSLAAYRIVQEALTNARKHAPSESIDLRLDWSATTLTIVVRNGVLPSALGAGGGILGMVERARMYGGTLDAGPEGDGWTVRARLPLPPLLQGAS